jgi:Uncharacterized membrane-associated protein/domain, COG2512
MRRVQEFVAMASQSGKAAANVEASPAPELNERQQLVIHAIQRMGGVVMQNSLAEATGLSPPTLSRVISSLERMGIVEKRRKGMTNEIKIVRR